MLRRRHDREVREAAHALAGDVAQQVHARLQDWALDAVTLPAQNRELSGHEGEMLLNAAYLIEADRVAELRDLVSELERRHEDIAARIELTGPWPAYNFVPDRG
jgi:Gas vesicle synthesis protein GvpL/GvpF